MCIRDRYHIYGIYGLIDEVRVHDKILKGNAVKESMQELSIELTVQLLALKVSTN